jgi:hypothetical protein
VGALHKYKSCDNSPVKVPSIFKAFYYVSFVNDYSKRTWVYFLRTKYEIFCQFKELKALLENHTSKNIKLLTIDNVSELCSENLISFVRRMALKDIRQLHILLSVMELKNI